jgi:hypothetical protein
MYAKGVRHVRNFVLFVSDVVKLGHWALVFDIGFGGSSETSLSEAALEDLHDTVRVCMAGRCQLSTRGLGLQRCVC